MAERLHDVRFPGESDDYRQARDELLRAEMEVRRLEAAVAAQRRELPLGGEAPQDYEFEEWDPTTAHGRGVPRDYQGHAQGGRELPLQPRVRRRRALPGAGRTDPGGPGE